MQISQEEAKRVIVLIRKAKDEFKSLASESQEDLCDRSKAALAALDVAELLVCDETTHEYREPRDLILLKKMLLALDLYKERLVERVTDCWSGLFT